jgi:ectoine hydroxylase-related dioxygenase (phytanoyl-CoA dioxygenase family)
MKSYSTGNKTTIFQNDLKIDLYRSMTQTIIQQKTEFFKKNGYVIFERAIEHNLIDRFTQDFDSLLQQNRPLQVNLAGNITSFQDILLDSDREKHIRYGRFINIENFSILGKELILHPAISNFLTDVYRGSKPTSLQSLTYKHSSQQGEHSDRYLVSPDWAGNYQRDTLTASWIALEDANEINGALIIYPGSHLIPNKKRLVEEFDNNYGAYVKYCQDICQQHGIKPEYFYAKKGDVLFWHGDFIHAGGVVKDWSKTRFSIVCHYANIDEEHFPLSLKNYCYYRPRVAYKNLGYFYQDLPKRHLQRDLLFLWDKILIRQHRVKVMIAKVRHYFRLYIIDRIKNIIKWIIGYESKKEE